MTDIEIRIEAAERRMANLARLADLLNDAVLDAQESLTHLKVEIAGLQPDLPGLGADGAGAQAARVAQVAQWDAPAPAELVYEAEDPDGLLPSGD